MMIQFRLLTLTKGVRVYLVGLVLIGLGISATYVGQGVLAAQIIAHIFTGGGWQGVVLHLLVIAGLVLVRATLIWGRERVAMLTVSHVKRKLRSRMYSHLLTLGPGFLERTRTGTIQSTLVDGVEALEGYLGYYIPQAFVSLLAPVLLLLYIFTLDPLVALLMFLCVMLIPLIPLAWSRLLGEYGKSHWKAYSNLNAQFVDSMQGMTTLKAFNASRSRGEALQAEANGLYRATMKQLSISMIRNGIVGLVMSAGVALAIVVGSLHLIQGDLALAALTTILFLSGECFRPLQELNAYWHQGYMGISASSGIFALLDARPDVASPAQPLPVERSDIRPAVTFEHVSFAYNDGNRPALRNFSLSIQAGERVALVGRSGAGKTTVVSLLFRFFDPQEGCVKLDGQALGAYDLATVRSMIAVVSQETYLFHGTIADNIRLGKLDATKDEVEDAARSANAHTFISTLPNGYNTIVGERGLKLSGGERQRIAIARALLKDAPILVLDEATSAIDAANEAEIQQTIERLTVNRTTLVIAHRLSTVKHADRICVVDNGSLVEEGSHGELLEKHGAYAQLVAAQQGRNT